MDGPDTAQTSQTLTDRLHDLVLIGFDGEDASVLYDATLKENFPPIFLPKKEFMENARRIWEELGLPALKPETPWYGYSLGEWDDDFDAAAELAVKSEYWEYGRRIAQRRRKDVAMNTEVRDVDETLPDDG